MISQENLFNLPVSVQVSGAEVSIRTDFRVILEIFVMLSDPDLSDADKTEALLRMFYPDPPQAKDTEAALAAFRSFVDPGSDPESKTPAKRSPSLVNWSHDFPLLVGPVNRVLGTECRALKYLHWYTFLAAYMDIDPESVFSQTLRIREKLRSGKKLEKYEREFYRRNPDLVDPPKALTSIEKDLLKNWS